LYIFGENRIKMYANVGGADFPFAEVSGATIDRGLERLDAVVVFNDSFYFMGGGLNERVSIWRGVGGSAGVQKISTDSIDSIFSTKESTDFGGTQYQTSGFMFEGRPFVSFRENNRVFWYDINSSAAQGRHIWCEFTHDRIGSSDGGFSRGGIIEAYGKIFYFGFNTIFELTKDNFNFPGLIDQPRIAQFSGAYLQNQSQPLIVNRLELVAETGVGTDIEVDVGNSDPQILLEYSDDQTNTWRSAGYQSLGKHGVYNKRLIWQRMGMTPTSRIFRFTYDSDVPLRLIRIDLDVTGGRR